MSSLYPSKRKAPEVYTTEFDILKAAHRFLRNDDPEALKSWETQLAKKYEDNLFKEFAVCDLKHYKSGNIALRWRTEDEVLSGAGETTCGNTRCPYHNSLTKEPFGEDPELNLKLKPPTPVKLTTTELPFSYIEQGETIPKQALVKTVLCPRCLKKLLWKREKDKRDKTKAGIDPNDKTTVEAGPSKKRDHRTRREDHRTRSRSRSPKRRI